jgi:trimethylamine-N-oxide reductase (cytochrome c)
MTFFTDKQTNLSRRSLLKGLGACAALPLLAGVFPKARWPRPSARRLNSSRPWCPPRKAS